MRRTSYDENPHAGHIHVAPSRLSIAVAALCLCLAFVVHATDWSSFGGAVIVPVGETWTATESDMVYVNALSSITVNGELVFSGCTTCPKADLLYGQGFLFHPGRPA